MGHIMKLLRRLDKPARCSVSANVGEATLKVSVWSTKGHLLYGLVQHKAFRFTVSHPQTIAGDMQSALRRERKLKISSRHLKVKNHLDRLSFAVFEKLHCLFTYLHASRFKHLQR